MTHEPAHSIAWMLAVGYALTAAAAPQIPMSDAQVVTVSVGSGMVGGFVSLLMSPVNLTARELTKRVLASGMLAPAIVAIVLVYLFPNPTLLQVVAAAGVAGLIAYPIAELAPKLAPAAVRKMFKKWLDGGHDG